MKLLLGLGSKARHGKDSAATAVLDHIERNNTMLRMHYASTTAVIWGRNFKFAAALYDECRQLHGMTEKDAPLLQKVGNDRRQENPRYWIDKVFSQIDEFMAQSGNRVAILTDVRYQNEAEEVKRRHGYLVNVTRLNADGTVFASPDRPADHISEVDLDGYNWDYYIRTYTGEEALAGEQAITLFQYIRGVHSGRYSS